MNYIFPPHLNIFSKLASSNDDLIPPPQQVMSLQQYKSSKSASLHQQTYLFSSEYIFWPSVSKMASCDGHLVARQWQVGLPPPQRCWPHSPPPSTSELSLLPHRGRVFCPPSSPAPASVVMAQHHLITGLPQTTSYNSKRIFLQQ